MPDTNADITIDAREMAPPEPFVATMDALETLLPGQKLLLILAREPHPLYRALQRDGYAYQTRINPNATVEILIWHAAG
jgi:uncharacterized protein (DUF2249 family)